MGWLRNLIKKGGTKQEFQQIPGSGPTPASKLDPNRLSWQDWGQGYPFYRGKDWSDYLSSGALVQRKDIKYRDLVKSNPAGTLIVDDTFGKEMHIPAFRGTIVSNAKIPNGYYKNGATLKVVTVCTQTQTITERILKLMPFYQARKQIDPTSSQFYDMHEEFINQSASKASSIGNWFTTAIVDKLNPATVANKIGIWVQMVTTTVPLAKIDTNRKSVLEGKPLPGSSLPNALPLLGKDRLIGTPKTTPVTIPVPSAQVPISTSTPVPFQPKKKDEIVPMWVKNVGIIGGATLLTYLTIRYIRRER
jgi:hypothetical protein